jgi:S1-C subfamily serine protease
VAGVFILRVQPGSAAERAGLKGASLDALGNINVGDVIQQIDAERLSLRRTCYRCWMITASVTKWN